MTAACMGGWCAKRGHCAHYHAENTTDPAERLCPPGLDGAGFIRIEHNEEDMPKTAEQGGKARQIHIPKTERMAQILAMLTPEGVTNADIVRAMGFTARARPAALLRELKEQGRVFGFGLGPHAERFFSNTVDRDAYAVKLRQEIATRRAEHCRRAQERYRSKSHGVKSPRELKQEAADAKRDRAAARAKSTIKRLQAQTRAAGVLPAADVSASPAPVRVSSKPRGPAFVAGEPDMSRARVTIAPPVPDRFAATSAPPVVTSRECRGWAKAVAA